MTDGREVLVLLAHRARKEIQVLEALDERVAVVCPDHPEFLVGLETKEVAENLVGLETSL